MTNLILYFGLFTTALQNVAASYVYVCQSEGAQRYHLRKDCRGLSNCEHEVVKITLEKARERGKTLCRWED